MEKIPVIQETQEVSESETKIMNLSETYWRDYLNEQNYNKDVNQMCALCIKEQIEKYGSQTIPCTGLNSAKDKMSEDLFKQIANTLTEQEIKEMDAIFDPYTYMEVFLDTNKPAEESGDKPLEDRWYQKLISKCSSQSKVIRLGRRAGKTYMMALMMLHEMLLTPKYKVLLVSPYAVQTEEVINTFKNLCSRLPEDPIVRAKQSPIHVIEFYNGSVLKGFTASTDANSVRGQCLRGDAKICVELKIINNKKGYFFNSMENLKNVNDDTYSITEGELYSVYKSTNLSNGKSYIGFHSLSNDEILTDKTEVGSIYKSGYLGSGKLLKKAVIKYGPENFKQELLFLSEEKKEAESFERELVNRDWTLRKDNYNISVGENVRELHRENNGFFGKSHSKELKDHISKKRLETKKLKNFSAHEIFLVSNRSIKFCTHKEVYEFFNIQENTQIEKYFKLCELIHFGIIEAKSKNQQNILLKNYQKRINYINREKTKRVNTWLIGVERSKDSVERSREGLIKWIKNNPEAHQRRMLKINKNPEKIKKMAETHRGMKRSLENKINMALSQKKIKRKFFNLNTSSIEVHLVSNITVDLNLVPLDFDLYINKEGRVRAIYETEEVPSNFTILGINCENIN